MTKLLFHMGTSHPPCHSKITVELIDVMVLVILWTVAMLTILNGDTYYNTDRDMLLAMAGM